MNLAYSWAYSVLELSIDISIFKHGYKYCLSVDISIVKAYNQEWLPHTQSTLGIMANLDFPQFPSYPIIELEV